MVDTLVPDYVDAKKIFAQQARISGKLPIARFSRFCELLADSSGNVRVSLLFSLDDNHRRIINGEIEADVSVICQRCLEPTQVQLTESFKLGLVETENHITKLPDDIDPWMVTDTKLVIADFLEEQLILSMPIVSYHSAGCKAALPPGIGSRSETEANNTRNREESPFAILKKLKERN